MGGWCDDGTKAKAARSSFLLDLTALAPCHRPSHRYSVSALQRSRFKARSNTQLVQPLGLRLAGAWFAIGLLTRLAVSVVLAQWLAVVALGAPLRFDGHEFLKNGKKLGRARCAPAADVGGKAPDVL